MSITLYEFSPTRSDRVRWTLLELGEPFESIEGRELIGSERLKRAHPLSKLPAIEDDGRPLFESAAICTWLADKHSDKRLIAKAGSWERALHDQWVCFALTEVEAHLWSTARNMFVYPEKARIPAIVEQNNAELRRALPVLNAHLADHDFMVGDRFSVTDIIVGFAVNWAQNAGVTNGLANLEAYNERLRARPHCPLKKMKM